MLLKFPRSLWQHVNPTTSAINHEVQETGTQKMPGWVSPPLLAGLDPRRKATGSEMSPTNWGSETIETLAAEAERAALQDGVRTSCHGIQPQVSQVPTHSAVRGRYGYLAISRTRETAVEAGLDQTLQKRASLVEYAASPQAAQRFTPFPRLTTPITKQAPEGSASSKSGAEVPPKGFGRILKATAAESSSRPNGEALYRIVPNVSNGAKVSRKFGRLIQVENENAIPQLLNRTKPEGGTVQGLAKAHMVSVVPSALALAHEGVNMVYAVQDVVSSKLRKNRYETQMRNWPISDDEPKIVTGGREVPLSEIARMTDFQSRYDLKVAILGQPAGSSDREIMLDVLLGRYVAYQGTNRVVRATFRAAMSAVGVGAHGALAYGTAGVGNAALAGGALLSSRDLLDNRKAMHGIKQNYRDQKEDMIFNGAVRNRVANQIVGEPSADEKASWRTLHNNIDQQYIERFLPIKFSKVNEYKSTQNKKKEVDLLKKHVAARVIGVLQENDNLHSLQMAYLANEGESSKDLKQFYHNAVRLTMRDDGSSDITSVVQLIRDLGMSKMEAISRLRSTVSSCIAYSTIDENQKAQMKLDLNPIASRMAQSPAELLELAIGSVMGRR